VPFFLVLPVRGLRQYGDLADFSFFLFCWFRDEECCGTMQQAGPDRLCFYACLACPRMCQEKEQGLLSLPVLWWENRSQVGLLSRRAWFDVSLGSVSCAFFGRLISN